ncbi:hypothetical protein SVIOM342S_03128 [Streptomyces violaceorubidus]
MRSAPLGRCRSAPSREGKEAYLRDQAADLGGLPAALAGQQGDQLLHLVLAHQQPLHAQLGREVHDDLGVDAVEEAVRRAQELGPVLRVAVRHHVEEEPQVVAEDTGVVLALEAGVGLAGLLGEEGADLHHGGDPVAHARRVGAPLRDRRGGLALAQPPVVAGLRDDVDALGQVVGPHGDRGVLVQPALGEGEAVLLPEGAAEDLVAGDAVGDELGVAGYVSAQPGLAGQHPHQRHLPGLLALEVVDVPGGEVRAALVEAADHEAVGVRRDQVVAVDEGQELGLGREVGHARVAGGAETAVLLAYELEARVAGGVLLGDGGGAVG